MGWTNIVVLNLYFYDLYFYELKGFHTPSERPEPMYLEYYPIAIEVSSEMNENLGSDGGCNSELDKTDSWCYLVPRVLLFSPNFIN